MILVLFIRLRKSYLLLKKSAVQRRCRICTVFRKKMSEAKATRQKYKEKKQNKDSFKEFQGINGSFKMSKKKKLRLIVKLEVLERQELKNYVFPSNKRSQGLTSDVDDKKYEKLSINTAQLLDFFLLENDLSLCCDFDR